MDEDLVRRFQDLLFRHQAGNGNNPTTPSTSEVKPANIVQETVHRNGSRQNQEILSGRMRLPIYACRSEIVESVRRNQVLILEGETGSGKSTQVTQFLRDAGFAETGKIGCTQPRRVAACSLAKRVAFESGLTLGDKIGYKIRFDDKSSRTSEIVYMTDGILLNEMAADPKIYQYSVVILDEAHERNVNTDILLGMLKIARQKRPDLKIIISSATMDANKFSRFFDNAPILQIPGQLFPVEEVYRGNPYSSIVESDYALDCAKIVMEIHRDEPAGDILVFLCGEEKIEKCYDELMDRDTRRELWVLPCYGALSMAEQSKAFEPTPMDYKRKVVLATNIAETSLTIDGIVYVVDAGVVKVGVYDPKTGLRTLQAQKISKAQAKQRKGRAGRTRPGKVYRLYSKSTYSFMQETPIPEIQRSNLDNAILVLAAYGIEDLYSFSFLEAPKREAIDESVRELTWLGALDRGRRFTEMGRRVSKFPLDPRLAKVLIVSAELGCIEDMLIITALMSVTAATGKIFLRPRKKQALADRAKDQFHDIQGDYHTLLKAYKTWVMYGRSEPWSKSMYLNHEALQEADLIHAQLVDVAYGQDLLSKKPLVQPNAIAKALMAGYYSKIARKGSGYGYTTWASEQQVFIHPSSAVFKGKPAWVLYEELTNSGTKTFMRNVTWVDPSWLGQQAPSFVADFRRKFPYFL